jgi:NADH:ubiquinone oxidoreductase subunit H
MPFSGLEVLAAFGVMVSGLRQCLRLLVLFLMLVVIRITVPRAKLEGLTRYCWVIGLGLVAISVGLWLWPWATIL